MYRTEEDNRYFRQIEEYRTRIIEFADSDDEYGWKTFTTYDEDAGRNVTITVPWRAFVCAAINRAHAWHLAPKYAAVCPMGLKLPNDDPAHTDAWLGAGLKLSESYDRSIPEQRLFMYHLYDTQHDMLKFEFDVLARTTEDLINGYVIVDPTNASYDAILVVADADADYTDAALKCAAVIVETGSKLAHLCVVAREGGIPVIRVEDATTRFRRGAKLMINFKSGKLSIIC